MSMMPCLIARDDPSVALGIAQKESFFGTVAGEKDAESGLDFALARYYNPTHGRFTSVDPLTASASIRNPQTFYRYDYVPNSLFKFSDLQGRSFIYYAETKLVQFEHALERNIGSCISRHPNASKKNVQPQPANPNSPFSFIMHERKALRATL